MVDYEKAGLKCGLEIHQQLDTHKLFCNCSSVLRSDEPDFIVKRKLHAVAGESGEIDKAAVYQASLDKEFVYQGYDTTCLVELDESPPREINKEALKIVLQVAIFLNARIFPLTQIMRKTVIDGSNTSGFQRTVLVARDGYVETEKGRVRIESICLEEDAARLVSKTPQAYPDKSSKKISTGGKDKEIYRLDRLGIPLIEIATAPDIKSPEQAKEVALHLGDILRSCKVKRGLGTIRQDVNVSIKKGDRIEIKGFQDIRNIERAIEHEIQRQKELIKEGKKVESEVRRVLPDGKTDFLRPMPGAARMYPETDLPLLKISRDLINEVKRNLPKLRSEIEKELESKGLNQEMIKLLFKENKLYDFEELLEIVDNALLVGKVLFIYPREIAGHEKISVSEINKILTKEVLALVLENFKKKKISENQIKNVLERIVKGEALKDAVVFEKGDVNVIEEKIMKLIKEKSGLSEKAYMGLVMKEFHGKIDGKEAIEVIRKYI